jgi:hypothetical protein
MQGHSKSANRLWRVTKAVKKEYTTRSAVEHDRLGAWNERHRVVAGVDGVGHPFHDARPHAHVLPMGGMPNVGRIGDG